MLIDSVRERLLCLVWLGYPTRKSAGNSLLHGSSVQYSSSGMLGMVSNMCFRYSKGLTDMFVKRLKPVFGRPDEPVGHGLAAEKKTVVMERYLLTVERNRVHVFLYHDVSY